VPAKGTLAGCICCCPVATGDPSSRCTVPQSACENVERNRGFDFAGATEDDDYLESPIPEQFVSAFRGGRWVTEPVSHSGG
jgi:Adenylate cyclase associated (CAP) C terminal